MVSLSTEIFIDECDPIGVDVVELYGVWVYLREVLSGSVVEGEEGFLFLADEHEGVVIVAFNIGGELDVRDYEVVVLVLRGVKSTCSYLVLNHSLALPYLTGIIKQILLELRVIKSFIIASTTQMTRKFIYFERMRGFIR